MIMMPRVQFPDGTSQPNPPSSTRGTRQTRRRWTIDTSVLRKGFLRRLTFQRLPPGQRQSPQTEESDINGAPNTRKSQTLVSSPNVSSSLLDQEHDCSLVENGGAHEIVNHGTAEKLGVERPVGEAERELEKPAVGTSKSSSSTSNLAEKEPETPRQNGINKLKKVNSKSRTPTVRRLLPQGLTSKTPEAVPPSTGLLGASSQVRDEYQQPLEKPSSDHALPTIVHPIEVDEQKSADLKASEQSTAPVDAEEVEKLRKELATSQSKVVELQKRCEAQQRSDTNGATYIPNTADKSSDSDIIQALQRLNAEVQQDATYMADCFMEDFEFRNVTNPSKEQMAAAQKAAVPLGRLLVQSLGTTIREDMAMLLPIAFQAFLTSALCQTASSWAIDSGQNNFINEIYQRLRRLEPQSSCGQWRSLTRVYITQTCITNPGAVVRDILLGLSDILVAAGCTASQSDIISKVSSKFEKKIYSLVSLAGRLNKMFDDIISSDFEVFIVTPGEMFEEKKMEDTDGGKNERRKSSVLCATHLGLIKQVPVGTLWEKGKKQKLMVLKAKVLLESSLTMD